MMFEHGRWVNVDTSTLPRIEVGRKEFVRLMMESGETKEKAERQADIGIALRSYCLIGGRMVKINDKEE